MKCLNQFQVMAKYPKGRPTIKDFGESLTVPDQAMTIKEILRRSALGQSTSVHSVYYDPEGTEEPDETLRPDFDLSDVSRIQDEIKENKARLDALKARKKSDDAKRHRTATPQTPLSEQEEAHGVEFTERPTPRPVKTKGSEVGPESARTNKNKSFEDDGE